MRYGRRRPVNELGLFRVRWVVLLLGILAITSAAVWRSYELQVASEHGRMVARGEERFMRVRPLPAHRGAILDRQGEILAMSTLADSVWINPQSFKATSEQLATLAKHSDKTVAWLTEQIEKNKKREFFYVVRHLPPEKSGPLRSLNISGLHFLSEPLRYYPAEEATSQVLGFTNIDDRGQEGLELGHDKTLAGVEGSKRVLQDRFGRTIEEVDMLKTPQSGQPLKSSLDLRIQHLTYQALADSVEKFKAKSGSAAIIDIQTGEVLAIANYPSYNPNDRKDRDPDRMRNRAATDQFEPGSTLKSFVVLAGLQSGKWEATTKIDTNPGYFQVGRKRVKDKRNLGVVDVETVLAKSSNVGVTRIALSLPPEDFTATLKAVGFGQKPGSTFPGEAAGVLPPAGQWGQVGTATLAYGYGMSASVLQLAQAYAVVGSYGIRRPVTFERRLAPPPGERVLNEKACQELIRMLETATSRTGTGSKASVDGYRVAGKTGTAWKASGGGYSTHQYRAVFAGVIPATRPRLAMAVVIDEPSGTQYYGGDVAAPVFAASMRHAVRLLGITPDNLEELPALIPKEVTSPAMEATNDEGMPEDTSDTGVEQPPEQSLEEMFPDIVKDAFAVQNPKTLSQDETEPETALIVGSENTTNVPVKDLNTALLGTTLMHTSSQIVRTPRRLAKLAIDPVIVVTVASLLLLGLIGVSSASIALAERTTGAPLYYLERQMMTALLGFVAGAILLRIPIQVWKISSFVWLAVALFGLALVLVPGLGVSVNGSQRWLRLGVINFQVSEAARVLLLTYFCGYLARREHEVRESLSGFFKPMVILGIASALLLAEPDFGAAVILVAVVLALVFLAGAPLRYFIIMTVLVIFAFAVLAITSPYRMRAINRIP
jgi:cell division protein FtsI (penicillin-binding protein 3)